ncbi:hypothetical protein FN846DRAFT_888689 [Sphaerosporella brunnea]|uniref:Uncharacterized protein n=1 Tax=Sphaerosporella brunnea TaxID=1250544 RepID=A0A5J5F1H2_9PEZI|nr:hypothetical protein FN846DRAFT_888689 [Sphaerosporella brunnea]
MLTPRPSNADTHQLPGRGARNRNARGRGLRVSGSYTEIDAGSELQVLATSEAPPDPRSHIFRGSNYTAERSTAQGSQGLPDTGRAVAESFRSRDRDRALPNRGMSDSSRDSAAGGVRLPVEYVVGGGRPSNHHVTLLAQEGDLRRPQTANMGSRGSSVPVVSSSSAMPSSGANHPHPPPRDRRRGRGRHSTNTRVVVPRIIRRDSQAPICIEGWVRTVTVPGRNMPSNRARQVLDDYERLFPEE